MGSKKTRASLFLVFIPFRNVKTLCRLLFVGQKVPFDPADYLAAFSRLAEGSPEYQGHGWGLAYQSAGVWHRHRDVRPIWESEFPVLPPTKRLLVHARSAFRNEGITIDN